MINLLSTRNIVLAIIAMVIASTVFSGMYTVNDRERGVILTNGKVTGVADPGLHLKIPFVQSVVFVSTQNQSLAFTGVTAYSKDQQTATLRVSVSYHVPAAEVSNVYSKFTSLEGLQSRLIERQVPTQVENVFGQYTAADSVVKRVIFGADIEKAVRASLVGPLVVDSVQVENIDFDDTYEANIRKMMEKNVEILTQKNETLRQEETNIQKVNLATAEAAATVAKANAEALAIRARGEADAYAIDVKAKALAQNQNLIQLTIAETWDGKLPTQMIPGSTVPFLNVK